MSLDLFQSSSLFPLQNNDVLCLPLVNYSSDNSNLSRIHELFEKAVLNSAADFKARTSIGLRTRSSKHESSGTLQRIIRKKRNNRNQRTVNLKSEGLQSFSSDFLQIERRKIDPILDRLLYECSQCEDSWGDLKKSLEKISRYHYTDPKAINQIKDTVAKLTTLISRTPIVTKTQSSIFISWLSIISYDSDNSISLERDLGKAEIYLIKLNEILQNSDQNVRKQAIDRANILFNSSFLKQCVSNKYWRKIKNNQLKLISNVFRLFGETKDSSYYYFIRNGLIFCKNLLRNAAEDICKQEISNALTQEFASFFQSAKFTDIQKEVVKKLLFLNLRRDGFTYDRAEIDPKFVVLSKFCQKTNVRDEYPYQKSVAEDNMKVRLFSALPLTNKIIAEIPEILTDTIEIFKKSFSSILEAKTKVEFDLFVASNKTSYEVYNYALIQTSTGNGGVLNYSGGISKNEDVPTITVYIQNDKIWNLEHECNHALFHAYIGFTHSLGKYGTLSWLNEGLSYFLVPNNHIEKNIKLIMNQRPFPRINEIITAVDQDYYASYALSKYLFEKQKHVLEQILTNKKNKRYNELKQSLEDLDALTFSFHAFLEQWFSSEEKTSSSIFERVQSTITPIRSIFTVRNTTNVKTTTQPQYSASIYTHRIDSNWEAVKKITYVSMGVFTGIWSCIALVACGLSKLRRLNKKMPTYRKGCIAKENGCLINTANSTV